MITRQPCQNEFFKSNAFSMFENEQEFEDPVKEAIFICNVERNHAARRESYLFKIAFDIRGDYREDKKKAERLIENIFGESKQFILLDNVVLKLSNMTESLLCVTALVDQSKMFFMHIDESLDLKSVELKDVMVATLELAERIMNCGSFVISLSKNRSDLKSVIHSLIYIGFEYASGNSFNSQESVLLSYNLS